MKLSLGADKFIEYLYELKKDDYMLGFSVKSQGIKTLVNASQTPELSMSLNGYRQEKSIEYENQQSALHYQLKDGDSDYLSVAGEDDEQEENINWIGFATKQGVSDVDFPIISGLYSPALKNPKDLEKAILISKENGASGISIFTADNLNEEQKKVFIKLKKTILKE